MHGVLGNLDKFAPELCRAVVILFVMSIQSFLSHM